MEQKEATGIIEHLAHRIIAEIKPSRLVVGLSGGADSTLALLIACKVREIDPDCFVEAVHCIHGLDADDPIWLAHCQKLCARVGVTLLTPKLHIVYGNGRSPEEVSRAERYQALLRELKGGVLVLGHQADDQAENFLLALKRGSGPKGLSGMRFITEDERGIIVRPLLDLTKAQIEEILEACGFDFVYDISNSYLKFERNFIRLKVLPLLKTRFAGIEGAILRSQSLCAQEHDLALRYVEPIFNQAFDDSDPFVLRLSFKDLPLEDENLMLFVLRLFLTKRLSMPPELSLLQSILKLMRTGVDQKGLIEAEGFEIRRFRSFLYLLKMPHFAHGQYELKANCFLRLGDFEYSLLEGSFKRVILDFDIRGGERIKPLKRVHSRELKKLYAEYDVPYFMRRSQCVIRDDGGAVLGVGDLFSCVIWGEGREKGPFLTIKRV